METRRGFIEQSSVRIGDAERDACAELLTEHHVRGRLSAEEVDRRHRAALSAETDAEIAALLTDLPNSALSGAPRSAAEEWWSLDPKVRAVRMARWAATPVSLTAAGVFVASNTTQNTENDFFAGLAAATLGYLTHVVITKWRVE